MLVDSVCDVIVSDMFFELRSFADDFTTIIKLEGLNPGGSIKMKTAVGLVSSLEKKGLLKPGSRIIESTSGNLGIALAAVCSARRYQLTLVTDLNANARSIQAMRALGAEVIVVSDRDANDGFLGTRIGHILGMLAEDPELTWLNQYANRANVEVHRDLTANEILSEVGAPDWLFVGAGTTGTLMGCVERFRGTPTKIVGVDAEGSVTFGDKPRQRLIPGLGTSRRPEIFDPAAEFRQVVVAESDTVRMCRRIASAYGLLLGGSSGTVLAAVDALREEIPSQAKVVAISPDQGDRYLDTIYNDSWVAEHFGPELLSDLNPPHFGEDMFNSV